MIWWVICCVYQEKRIKLRLWSGVYAAPSCGTSTFFNYSGLDVVSFGARHAARFSDLPRKVSVCAVAGQLSSVVRSEPVESLHRYHHVIILFTFSVIRSVVVLHVCWLTSGKWTPHVVWHARAALVGCNQHKRLLKNCDSNDAWFKFNFDVFFFFFCGCSHNPETVIPNQQIAGKTKWLTRPRRKGALCLCGKWGKWWWESKLGAVDTLRHLYQSQGCWLQTVICSCSR